MARGKRKYNLAAYECRRDHHSSGCTACSRGITGCACGNPFHSTGAQSCFLPHSPFLYAGRLAMADTGARPFFLHGGIGFVWGTGCQSTLPFYSGGRAFNRTSYFYPFKLGYTQSDVDAPKDACLPSLHLNSTWGSESSGN